MAGKISEASVTLGEITHELPDGAEKSHKVRHFEHQCDKITRHIYERLNESQIMLSTAEIAEGVNGLEILKNPDDVKSLTVEINRIYTLSIDLPAKVVLDLFKTKISCSQLSSRIYMKD